jgi:uncharacterized peroxidase-related enzyme
MRISPVTEEEAQGRVKEIYDEIRAGFGRVPNLFKTMAHRPEILEANWSKVKAVLLTGKVPRETKELIAYAVSQANECAYCVAAHGRMLEGLGFSRERIEKLGSDIASAGLEEKERRIVQFCVQATRDPKRITDGDVEALKALGVTEEELVEIVSTMDLFTSFNKFLDALSVEIDF